jgi:probable rRNA maturation factor
VPRRGVPGAASLRRWAAPFRKAATLRIVGAREGRALNRAFRNKDYATNVLSFPYGSGEGDVVLCHPVIVREARAQRKSLSAHYAHLVLHGMLHLGGHRHATRKQAAAMERAEIRMLSRLGYADPYTIE